MFKITFLGAGSTVFAKNVLGDCILRKELGEFDVALFDIDENRLEDSRLMLENINNKYHGKAKIKSYTNRLEALKGSNFIVNAVQIGGYEPCTVTDFEIPKKYGLRQTIADTLGVGGVFRALRTIPVLEDFANDMQKVCPDAIFLNYTNPMSMLTGYMQKYLDVKTVGLCHSVQVCAQALLDGVGMEEYVDGCTYEIAGINHQAWLLAIKDKNGVDLYPEIKRRSLSGEFLDKRKFDLVRHEIMHRFGYYNTESSEHTAEYSSFFIKKNYPELIERFNIPLDEYPRRCVNQINEWKSMRDTVLTKDIEHEISREYASNIVNAVVNNVPYTIHGNVLNKNFITNLPYDACVEVKCVVDGTGITPTFVGDLPEQCAALNRNNINVQNLVIQAAREKKKELVYMAGYLDAHAAAELSLDQIKAMYDELFEAHKDWLPKYN